MRGANPRPRGQERRTLCEFCTPHVPFVFDFESERPNGNLVTVFHSAVQTRTQKQTERGVFRKHVTLTAQSNVNQHGSS